MRAIWRKAFWERKRPTPVSRNQQGTSNITFHFGLKEGNSTYRATSQQSTVLWVVVNGDVINDIFPFCPPHTRTLLSIVASLSFCFSTPTYPSIHSCILCPPSGFIPSNSKLLFATEQNRSEWSSLKLGWCEKQQYTVEQTGVFCTLWRKYVSVSLTIQ